MDAENWNKIQKSAIFQLQKLHLAHTRLTMTLDGTYKYNEL